MSVRSKPFELLTEDDLFEHIAEAIPEGRTLDYKLQLPGGTNEEKVEFLADMSSFANASGGHVVYGMEEAGGLATVLSGVTGIDPDAEVLRLEGMVQSSLDPRIPGIAFRAIPLRNGNVAIVASIPESPAAPHMITFQGRQVFYSRNSAGKYKMDVGELRAAFTSAGLLASVRLELEGLLASLIWKTRFRPKGTPVADQWEAALNILPEEDRATAQEMLSTALDQLEVDMPFPRHWAMTGVADKVRLDPDPSSRVTLNQTQRVRLGMYLLGGPPPPESIRTAGLQQVAALGSLLAYDPATASLQHSDLSKSVADLLATADAYRSLHAQTDTVRGQVIAELSLAARTGSNSFDLDMPRAALIWGMYNLQVNLYRRAASLYAYLTGKRSSPAPDAAAMLPGTPFGELMQAQIERENATIEDVRRLNEIEGFWNV